MKEIELKILNIDKAKITQKLLDLGAVRVSSELLIDKHYDTIDGRVKKKNDSFRLRKIGDKTELTYKYGKTKNKKFIETNEVQTNIENYDAIEKIIELLGLKLTKQRERKRTSFVLGKIKIEIDENPKIPAYLEIEGDKKNIEKTVKLLGFSMEDTTNLTVGQVLKSYGVESNFLKFEKWKNESL